MFGLVPGAAPEYSHRLLNSGSDSTAGATWSHLCTHIYTSKLSKAVFSKWSSFSGIAIQRGTWERSWVASDLFLSLQVTSSMSIGMMEGHTGRPWDPHHARLPKARLLASNNTAPKEDSYLALKPWCGHQCLPPCGWSCFPASVSRTEKCLPY